MPSPLRDFLLGPGYPLLRGRVGQQFQLYLDGLEILGRDQDHVFAAVPSRSCGSRRDLPATRNELDGEVELADVSFPGTGGPVSERHGTIKTHTIAEADQ